MIGIAFFLFFSMLAAGKYVVSIHHKTSFQKCILVMDPSLCHSLFLHECRPGGLLPGSDAVLNGSERVTEAGDSRRAEGLISRASASRRSCISRSLIGSDSAKKLAEYSGASVPLAMKPPRPSCIRSMPSLEAAFVPPTFYIAPTLIVRLIELGELPRIDQALLEPLGLVALLVPVLKCETRRAAFTRTRRLKGSGAASLDLKTFS
jgi:hypothetical protein